MLKASEEYPLFIVLEPLNKEYKDQFFHYNIPYPRAAANPAVRYLGEIYQTKKLEETKNILVSHQFRFQENENIHNQFLAHPFFYFTIPSYYTNNIVGYTESDLRDLRGLCIGACFQLDTAASELLEKADMLQETTGLKALINGIDHLATRIYCHEREDAILEFLSLSNYYFWGAYNIDDMNSSTNICRHPEIERELLSPAKVFTANNEPYYTNTITNLPSPTEDFVRNFGKRMHHIAYEVEDGTREDGTKNIDYVVNKLVHADIKFLENIIGECTDFPDLKQIFSKSSPYSHLITEYVQRCHGFEGFFTKTNVGYLTQAAGKDEAFQQSHAGPVHD